MMHPDILTAVAQTRIDDHARRRAARPASWRYGDAAPPAPDTRERPAESTEPAAETERVPAGQR
ncbi:hypothetical protein CLV63_12258 [Murinocardiopsis flavida]|uniref:Uncharacterized protein n=1 Tax=Murinocardiopsis flavida TaxID=645275 RepID=A0A2P8CZY7_9ACTN|nr:hypothetical protein [Murinocardiopsis flavida]PSK90524.1 hypothetical protein CLV63_12258 [Murinocardiopsis flavida]